MLARRLDEIERTMPTLLLTLLLLSQAPEKSVLRDHDRVVFLGDSITALHTYSRLVEVAVRLRHPDWSITFVNAGVGGNTVRDALERLEVDVLAHAPTVVFVNFGMNDASYPDGSADANFEKNLVTLLERLNKAKVRTVVWLDTTPYDASAGAMTPFNRHRVNRITELVDFAKTAGAERNVPVVPVNDAMTRALASWKASKRLENLMPDHIHPGPTLLGVMAAQVLVSVGLDVSPTKYQARVAQGVVHAPGLDGGVDWAPGSTLVLEVAATKAPLPFVLPLADAKLLDAPTLVTQASLQFALKGLPPRELFSVKAGTQEVGRFSGAQLAEGIELMQTSPPRVAPGPERADLTICEPAAPGNPWANDVSCVFNLLFGRDQLRVAMRHEKTRGLPDSVPGFLERHAAFQADWLDAVERDLEQRVKALVARPHVVVVEPVARDAK
jgi:lysophospholipase L1-like esterase